jgi:hypothetical protein
VILTHFIMFRFVDGAGQAATPPAPSAFNNSTQNWLSPTMHLGLLLGLWWTLRGVP